MSIHPFEYLLANRILKSAAPGQPGLNPRSVQQPSASPQLSAQSPNAPSSTPGQARHPARTSASPVATGANVGAWAGRSQAPPSQGYTPPANTMTPAQIAAMRGLASAFPATYSQLPATSPAASTQMQSNSAFANKVPPQSGGRYPQLPAGAYTPAWLAPPGARVGQMRPLTASSSGYSPSATRAQ